jgi:hypothetical protein
MFPVNNISFSNANPEQGSSPTGVVLFTFFAAPGVLVGYHFLRHALSPTCAT